MGTHPIFESDFDCLTEKAQKMTDGFDNENFVNDEMDGTITLLLLGLQRSGKTRIKMRVFDQVPGHGFPYVGPTTEIKCFEISCFKKIRVIDIPGDRNFTKDIPQENWADPVEQGGLGIGPEDDHIAAIYVVDSQDHYQQDSEYIEAMDRMQLFHKELTEYNSKIKFEVFLHKSDQLSDDQEQAIQEATYGIISDNTLPIAVHTTDLFNQTIFEATSRVIQKLIREQAQLENLLNMMISKASVAKAYLYDVQTKLYVATDSMQHMQHYSVHMEICSGMIEMVYRINNYYECRRDDAEDQVTPFDENTECWSTMDNQILTCLFGITPSLALVCVLKDDVAEKRGQLTHNLLSFRQSVRDMLKR